MEVPIVIMIKQPESTSSIILKKSFNVFIFTALATPLGYVMRILFSHSLSVEMFGLFYAVLAFCEVFAPFQDMGTGFSLGYFVPKLLRNKDEKSVWSLFTYSMIIRFVISLSISWLIVINADFLATTYFKAEAAKQLLYVFAVYLVISSLSTGFNQLFVGLQKEKYYASAEPLRLGLIVLFSAITWLLDKDSVLVYATIWSLAYVILLVYFIWLFLRGHSHLISPVVWKHEIAKRLTAFSAPVLINNVIFLFTNQIGLFILVYFHSVTEVGAFNVVLPIVSIPLLFIVPLQNVLFPMVSDFMHIDKSKVKTLIENMLKIVPIITLYFNFFVFLFPQYTLGLLFSNKWIESATLPLMAAAIGFSFSTVVSCLTVVADGMGLVKEKVKLMTLIAIINVVISSVLISIFNVTGLVISSGIIFVLTALGLGRLIYSQIAFTVPLLLYGTYALLLLGLFALVKFLAISPDTWFQYLILGCIYTAVTLAFAASQGLFKNKITHMFLAYIKKK